MPEGQREQVRAWLGDMVGSFRDARYVVTSRPAAIGEGWLEGLGFAASELQPMSAIGCEGVHPPVARGHGSGSYRSRRGSDLAAV